MLVDLHACACTCKFLYLDVANTSSWHCAWHSICCRQRQAPDAIVDVPVSLQKQVNTAVSPLICFVSIGQLRGQDFIDLLCFSVTTRTSRMMAEFRQEAEVLLQSWSTMTCKRDDGAESTRDPADPAGVATHTGNTPSQQGCEVTKHSCCVDNPELSQQNMTR